MMEKKKELLKKVAPLFILLAGLLWGSMGLFVRSLNAHGLQTMEIVALRAYVTCIAMFFILLIWKPKLLKISWKDIWCFLGTGICSIVFFNYCYFKAITITSMSVAAILLYTAPAIVMALSMIFFNEKLTKRKASAIVLTFIGCVLVTGVLNDADTISGFGVLVGLGAGFGYALYSVFSRFALERGYHTLTITFYTFWLASLSTLFLCDNQKILRVACESSSTLILCIALGIVNTIIPYLAYTFGLNYVENSKASVIASIEPVAATILGALVFGENVTYMGAFGIVVVIVALIISEGKEKDI